jgi:enoyl-CoA hydratase
MTETTDNRIFDVSVDGYVALVSMRRDPVNAQNVAFREQCMAVFDELGMRDDVRVIILTGNGRVFSAGADLNDRPDPGVAGAYLRHNRTVRGTFDSILSCPKPIIAAIDGPAIAAGFVLASVCDILLCSDTAWISMPEVEVGLAGGVRHVLRHFGQSDARLAMFTGRRIPGPELYRMNVVSACVPAGELLDAARAIAGQIVANAPLAVAAAKRSFLVGEELSVHTGYSFEQGQTALLANSADFAEAQAARKEKRPPEFRGK